jgi:hypothetical protein
MTNHENIKEMLKPFIGRPITDAVRDEIVSALESHLEIERLKMIIKNKDLYIEHLKADVEYFYHLATLERK